MLCIFTAYSGWREGSHAWTHNGMASEHLLTLARLTNALIPSDVEKILPTLHKVNLPALTELRHTALKPAAVAMAPASGGDASWERF